MPISRRLATFQGDVNARIKEFATMAVRSFDMPMTDNGWVLFLIEELDIDREMAERLFQDLLKEGIFVFLRIKNKKTIYTNDITPNWKRIA